MRTINTINFFPCRACSRGLHYERHFADRLKLLAWDGSGLVLFWKRLEQGAFRWPPISDGVMRLSASQLAALVDGMDWSRLYTHDVPRPQAAS